MADEGTQLVIDLEARLTKFEKAFKKASGIANDNWRSVEARGKTAADRMDATFARFGKPRHTTIHVETSGIAAAQAALNNLKLPHDMLNFEHLKGGVGGIAAGLGLSEVSKLADLWTQAGNRIAAADVEARRVPIVLSEVADIAMRSRTNLEQVAQVFAGLNRAGRTFGATQAQALVATEAVTKALTLSGSSTQEVQGALQDLTQGLQAGVLQGNELRALLKEVPDFAAALAKELHVGVGELKEMGSTGEITADKVFRALVNASGSIDEKFARTSATIEQAYGNMETAAARFVGTNTTVQAATHGTTAALQAIANHFAILGTGAGALAVIIATRLIAAGVVPLTASLAASARQAMITSAAHAEFSAIVGASSVRLLAGSVAARTFAAALSLIGGPWGLAILAIGTAATIYASEAQKASVASQRYAADLEKLKATSGAAADGIRHLGDAAAETAARMDALEANRIGEQLKQAEADAKTAGDAITNAADAVRLYLFNVAEGITSATDKVPGSAHEAEAALKDVEAALHGDAEAALRAENELAALANANPNLQPLADKFLPLLERLAGVRASVAALKADLAGLSAGPAKPADLHAFGTFDAGKARDQFSAQASKDAIDEAQKNDAWRLRQKAAELLKANPGILRPVDAFKTGAAVIAAEDEDSGHKGRTKHPRTPKPKKTDEEKESEKHDKAVKDEIKSLEEESRVQDAATAAQGKSNAEKRTATELAKLKVDATSKEGQALSNLIAKIEGEKDALAKLEKQRDAIASTAGAFRDGFAGALDDIIVKGERADRVFANLLKSFESMALKGLLTGEGSFGGLFGMGGASDAKNPAGGGLFGLALKGLGAFADGGQITGPGGPREDGILARVSAGEFIVNADAASKNLGLLHAINGGKLPAFADGGVVGGGSVPRFSGAAGASGSTQGAGVMVHMPVTLHANGTPEENKALLTQMGNHVEERVRRIFAQESMRQMKLGGLLDGTNFTR